MGTNINKNFQISDPVGCSRFIWILILPKKILSIQYDNYFQVPFNCEFLLIRNDGVNYEITEIYRVNSQSNSTQFNFGYYTDNYNLEINEKKPLRDNLQGKEMIVEEPEKIVIHLTLSVSYLHKNADLI